MTGRLRPARSPLDWSLLALGFVVVHVGLGWIDVADLVFRGRPTEPAGDVTGVYRFWVDWWHSTGVLVGISIDWVYPIGALPPMLLAGILGDGPFLVVWLGMVAVLDGVALLLVARRGRGLAWWWIGFTALLGPIAPARIDAVALPIAVVGVLLLADRPAVAVVLLTIAAWVKVWPAAIVVAVVVSGRRALRAVLAAVLASAAIIGIALLAGAGGHVLSFVSAQADRSLQVEAPAALPWLWSAALGDPHVGIYYDTQILTYQLTGTGVHSMAAVLTPVLAIGVLAVVVLALLARRHGAPAEAVLAVASLGFVSAVIALNKVGSPQYLTWYVAPILLGLLVAGRRFRVPAALVLVAGGLTQLIYPWYYDGVVSPEPWVIAVLTVRNGIELVLLGWCLVSLRTLPPPPALAATPTSAPGARSAAGDRVERPSARL